MFSKNKFLYGFIFAFLLGLGIGYTPIIEVDETHSVQFVSKYSDSEITCLAKNIYYEARGESIQGKMAVAFTTMNRVNDEHWPKTICGVVKQKFNKTCQFSWYCSDDTKKIPLNRKLYAQCELIAQMVANGYGSVEDITHGATFYHNDSVSPNWSNTKFIKKIDSHLFYSLKI